VNEVSKDYLDSSQALELKKQIPSRILELIANIEQAGFNLTLVGGAVRDYLLEGRVSRDLDFELGHQFEYDSAEWSTRINNLGTKLSRDSQYEIEFLNFSILRVSFLDSEDSSANENDWDVELAPARIESFSTRENYGHSDVNVELVSKAPYSETFKRRDFTVNAIGIEFHHDKEALSWADPFDGRAAIKEKVLKTANPHFSKDPVRFCRALRFSLKLDLSFDESLLALFKEFNLIQLSTFYFFREAKKVGYLPFFTLFFEQVDSHAIEVGPKIEAFRFLSGHGDLRLADEQELVAFMAFANVDLENLRLLAKTLQVKMNTVQGLKNLKDAVTELSSIDADFFKIEALKGAHSFLGLSQLSALKSLHLCLYKEELIKPLKMSNPQVMKQLSVFRSWLPEQLQGKDFFLELMEKGEFKSKEKSLLQYYCHFKERSEQNS